MSGRLTLLRWDFVAQLRVALVTTWVALAVSLLYPSAAVALLYRRFRRRAMAG